MHSDTKRLFSPYRSREIAHHQTYYSQERPWDRISTAGVLIPALLLLLVIVYQSWAPDARLISLHQSFWDGIVSIIPGKVIVDIDRWLNPPRFPTASVRSQRHSHADKSDALRRILGVDKPGGIVMSVSRVGRRGLDSLSGATKAFTAVSNKPPGLGNIDNSCYQNSVIQGLASLKPLLKYLSVFSVEGLSDTQSARTTGTLRELITELNDPSNKGKVLWTPGLLKNMSTWQQQDAQEYFSKLLDEIDKEIAQAIQVVSTAAGLEIDCPRDDTVTSQHSDDSGYHSTYTSCKPAGELRFARNPLEGLMAQRVACVACGYSEGLSMIPFNCITLNLGVDQAEYDLYERLDSYTKVEPISGVECAKCTLLKVQSTIINIMQGAQEASSSIKNLNEPLARLQAIEETLEGDDFDEKALGRCKIPPQARVSSTKTKQAVIARSPQSLIAHMNRSVFDERTGLLFKNSAAVRFPMLLDLGPWCLGSAGVALQPEVADGAADKDMGSPGEHDEEQWSLDPTSSMVAGDGGQSKLVGPIYELRAVITHYGRHENGHYVCYRRLPSSEAPKKGHSDGEDNLSRLEESTTAAGDDKEGIDIDGVSKGKDEPTDAPSVGGENQWWRFSDQDVAQVTEEHVLGEGGVFMLFYDCVDPTQLLASTDDMRDDLGSENRDYETPTQTQDMSIPAGDADVADVTLAGATDPSTASDSFVEPEEDSVEEGVSPGLRVGIPLQSTIV